MVLVSTVNAIDSTRLKSRKCQQMMGRNNPPYFFLAFLFAIWYNVYTVKKGDVTVLNLKLFMFSFLLATILFILVGAQALDKNNEDDETKALIVCYASFSCLATTTAIIYGVLCFVIWG